MKKIITFVIAAAMIAAMLTVAAGAQSIAPNGSGWDGDPVTVKKANPSAVVKDGIISDGEYEQYFPNLSDEESPLQVVYINGDNLDSGFKLLATMQYFFSWDEVHGFNFAVRGKPDQIQQLLGVKEGDKPEDDFLHNVGWGISAETDNDASPTLYYALAKRTDNGNYLEGHYNQLGAQANYNPTPVQDYEIAYDYSTGYCTIEWSIPLNNFFTAGGGAGSTIKATIWMCAGMTTEADDYSDFYGVSLGDFGYAVNVKSMINHVSYTLSDDPVSAEPPQSSEESSEEPTTAPTEDPSEDTGADDPTGPVDSQTEPQDSEEGGDVITDDTGDTDPVGRDDTDPAGDEDTDPAGRDDTDPAGDEDTDPAGDEDTKPAGDDGKADDGKADPEAKGDEDIKTDGADDKKDDSSSGKSNNGGKTPATGDPMIVLAAVAAVSAAGAVIIAKKRH